MKKILLLATIMIFTFSCKNENTTSEEINSKAEAITQDETKKIISNPKTTSFEIEGMTCAVGCAATIEKKLAKLEGVGEAKVDFESKTATVTFDADKLDQNKLTKTVEAVGGGKLYKVSKINF